MTQHKTVDPIQAVQQEILNLLDMLGNGEDVEIKKKILKETKRLDKHLKNKSDEQDNGKVYPEDIYGYNKLTDEKPMDKEEILKIISKTDTHENNDKNCYVEGCYSTEGTYVEDPSGVSVNKNRFIEIDEVIDIRTHKY